MHRESSNNARAWGLFIQGAVLGPALPIWYPLAMERIAPPVGTAVQFIAPDGKIRDALVTIVYTETCVNVMWIDPVTGGVKIETSLELWSGVKDERPVDPKEGRPLTCWIPYGCVVAL